MQEWLPLFPLQVVLLPGAELPLHIFEERYKEMIREAVRDKTDFGVVLANDKGIVSAGCTAVIDKVLREYPDGRMDIMSKGRRRFEILDVNEERVFLRGKVAYFEDDDLNEAPPQDLLHSAIHSYNELRALEASAPLSDAEAKGLQVSFRLAQPVADLAMRQALLVARSEAERIRQLAAFLPEYVDTQKQIVRIKRVAPRNGHGHSDLIH
ncbi:MAG: LON peptidase substrate-binding domain-containing protein [Bryobacteraceae bacterium]